MSLAVPASLSPRPQSVHHSGAFPAPVYRQEMRQRLHTWQELTSIQAAAFSKGWANPQYEGGMTAEYFMTAEEYAQEIERMREKIKAI